VYISSLRVAIMLAANSTVRTKSHPSIVRRLIYMASIQDDGPLTKQRARDIGIRSYRCSISILEELQQY